jgi:hypothetical protein
MSTTRTPLHWDEVEYENPLDVDDTKSIRVEFDVE